MLTRENILNPKNLRRVRVDVPEWADGQPEEEAFVFVREMTAGESRRCSDVGAKDVTQGMAMVIAFTACGEDGKPILRPDDAKSLKDTGREAFDRVYSEAMILSGHMKRPEEEVDDEGAAKNLETAPEVDSSSDSA